MKTLGRKDIGKLEDELKRGKGESSESKAGWMLVHVLRTEKLGERKHKVLFPYDDDGD